MEIVFGDAFFFIAWLNDRDEAHERAMALAVETGRLIVTTDYVLVELADALAETKRRGTIGAFFQLLRQSRTVEIVEASRGLLDKGLDLYAARPDKAWSLTDCISFVVMRERKIVEALTHDHHFKQAGFRVLL
jgi:uncharacterized protein